MNVGQITGQLQPGTNAGNFAYFNYVPDGTTVAYTDQGTIYQTVSATVQAGETYTLLVDVGLRNDGFPGAPVVELVIGNTVVTATGAAPPTGGWSTYRATYKATASDAGKSITIQLSSATAQGDFDNVRLSDAPEPATNVLGILGLAGLLPVLRARRRKSA